MLVPRMLVPRLLVPRLLVIPMFMPRMLVTRMFVPRMLVTRIFVPRMRVIRMFVPRIIVQRMRLLHHNETFVRIVLLSCDMRICNTESKVNRPYLKVNKSTRAKVTVIFSLPV
jgi:hypothetical protein